MPYFAPYFHVTTRTRGFWSRRYVSVEKALVRYQSDDGDTSKQCWQIHTALLNSGPLKGSDLHEIFSDVARVWASLCTALNDVVARTLARPSMEQGMHFREQETWHARIGMRLQIRR